MGDGAGIRASANITPIAVGQIKHVTLAWTSSAMPSSASFSFWRSGDSPSAATLRIDSFIITEGTVAPAYNDGNSPGWTWSGAANNSTSREIGP